MSFCRTLSSLRLWHFNAAVYYLNYQYSSKNMPCAQPVETYAPLVLLSILREISHINGFVTSCHVNVSRRMLAPQSPRTCNSVRHLGVSLPFYSHSPLGEMQEPGGHDAHGTVLFTYCVCPSCASPLLVCPASNAESPK